MNQPTRTIEIWRCALLIALVVFITQMGTTLSLAVLSATSLSIFVDFLFLSYCNGLQVDYIQRRFIFIHEGLDKSYGAIWRTFRERLPNSFSSDDHDQLRGVLSVAIFIFLLYLVFGVIPRLIVQILWGSICMIWYFVHWAASYLFNSAKEGERHSNQAPLLAIGIYVLVLYTTLGMLVYLLL